MRRDAKLHSWTVWLIALLLILLFVPTGVRLFKAHDSGFLNFKTLETELSVAVLEAIAPDSFGIQRMILSERAIVAESLLAPNGNLDRWSYAGKQMATLAHRWRLWEKRRDTLSAGSISDWVTTEHLVAERMRGRLGGRVELNLNTGALNVLSPFSETRWTQVLSRDARVGLALVRDGATLYFDPPASIQLPDPFPPGWCAAIQWSPETLGLRCGSAAGGLESDRFVEFRLSAEAERPSNRRRLVAAPRRGLTVEGARVYPDTVHLRAGQLLRSAAFEGGFVALAASGTIIDTQRVNGRGRLVIASPRYGQIGLALSRVRVNDGPLQPIPLSLSPSLTATLDSVLLAVVHRANARGASRNLRVVNAELVAVDIRTGDILALSGTRDPGTGAYLPGTTPRWIGSAVKPMIAAAVLSAHPELENLLVSTGERVERLDGRPLLRPFNAGCGGGAVSLRRGLRCSSNAFSAELLTRGLRLSGVTMSLVDSTRYDAGLLSVSPIAQAMESIWGTPLDSRGGEPNPDQWARNDPQGVGARFLSQNGGLLPERSATHLLVPQSRGGKSVQVGPTLDQLARIAFGQGDNEWTLLDAAATFARVVSGRRVEERFLAYGDGKSTAADFSWRGTSWHRTLLAGLTDVVRHPEGTASEVGERVDRKLERPVRLLGKTGTAQLDEDGFVERNAFVGAISLVKGIPEAPLNDGIAFALMVDYEDPDRAGARATATAARTELRVHRELAAEVSVVLGNYLRARQQRVMR